MSTPGVRIRLVLYAPHGEGALLRLDQMRAGLPPAEVTSPKALELDGPQGRAFDYNSKMQLKGQTLEWSIAGCDGQVHAAHARQALLKGAHGVLLFAASAADVSALESALQGDFDQVAGKNYALAVAATDPAAAKGHLHLPAAMEPAPMLKELMKAALKVVASSM